MNNSIFHRRRVERFAQLLEEAGRPRHSRSAPDPGTAGVTARPGGTALDHELTEYVELGRRLRAVEHTADATPEDGFRTSVRAMLVATAQREGIGCTAGTTARRYRREGVPRPVPPPSVRATRRAAGRAKAYLADSLEPLADEQPGPAGLRSRRTRGAIIIGFAAGTLALSGMSAASSDARPGDVLYSVKRSTESARLALTTTDMVRGQLYLDFAGNRANEAARAGSGSGLVALLNDMDSQTVQGIRLLTTWTVDRRDPSALDFVDGWVTTQHARLSRLYAGSRRQRVGQSLGLLQQIQNRSATLRAALRCQAGSAAVDTLGPVPGPCPATSVSSGNTGSHPGGSGTLGGVPRADQGNGPGAVGPAGPLPADTPTTVPSPATQTPDSPTQNINPQLPQPTATKSHKADAAGAGGMLGGLL